MRCGNIAIIGRPNVGKSTFLNCVLKYKLSITSRKPNTTRNAILGVYTKHDTQLLFMDTPGFDPVSATGQIAGGANLIAFTTGRGSCFGAKPTPSIKLATNSSLYKKMYEDMDINCGLVIDGDKDIEEMGKIIFEEFISFASGKKTKSEILNLGRHEFAPWQIGITG